MNEMPLDGKRILVTGGTGSLGKVLVRRLLACDMGRPSNVIVFSRDEAKQHYMRVEYEHAVAATDEIIYRNFQRMLQFRIGDVRAVTDKPASKVRLRPLRPVRRCVRG